MQYSITNMGGIRILVISQYYTFGYNNIVLQNIYSFSIFELYYLLYIYLEIIFNIILKSITFTNELRHYCLYVR